MFKISQQQIEIVISAFHQANAPVQMYEGLVKLFQGLEVIKEEEPKVEEKPTTTG